MRVIVKDPKGIVVGGKVVPKGDVIEAGGASLDAWLHFKQVVPANPDDKDEAARIKKEAEEKAAEEKRLADEKAAKEEADRKAADEKLTADEKARLETETQAKAQKRDARAKELQGLARKEQDRIASALGINHRGLNEHNLISAILEAEEAKA